MHARLLQSARPPALPLLYRGRWIFASAILCIICIAGLVGFAIYDSYRSTETLAIQSSETLEALIDEDISRDIDVLNLSLQGVIDDYHNPKIMALEPSLRQETLFDRSATAEGLGAILVLDEHGDATVMHATGKNTNHIAYRSNYPDASVASTFDRVSDTKYTLHGTYRAGGKTIVSVDTCLRATR